MRQSLCSHIGIFWYKDKEEKSFQPAFHHTVLANNTIYCRYHRREIQLRLQPSTEDDCSGKHILVRPCIPDAGTFLSPTQRFHRKVRQEESWKIHHMLPCRADNVRLCRALLEHVHKRVFCNIFHGTLPYRKLHKTILGRDVQEKPIMLLLHISDDWNCIRGMCVPCLQIR